MNGRRSALGLCIASALIVSAFAAQSASAETTAFTCSENVTTKTWSDPHCTNTGGTKAFGHVAIAENKTTTITSEVGTSIETLRLKAIIIGIPTELVTTTVTGSGSVHNATVGGKKQATGSGSKTYTNVTVAAPASKGCQVYTDNNKALGEPGVIHTNGLKGATTEEMGLRVEPAAGNVLTTFFISGCKGSEALEGLNKTYEVTGSVVGEPNGGEIVFTHAKTTEQNTLKINGIKAGIEGSTTIKGKDPENPNELYKSLTATTPPYTTD
jgi:hypothetical protein